MWKEIKEISEITCLLCSSKLTEIIDLGMHPFADSYIPLEMENFSEPVYPLKCGLCNVCGYIQNIHITSADDRYNLYPYSYESSNSSIANAHWDEFVSSLKMRHMLKNKKVLEIGSNDGTLLGRFTPDSSSAIGIDSSKEMCEIARSNGVDCINALFTNETAHMVQKEYGTFDFIIANNVFNHANSPVDFLQGCVSLLNASGKLIIQVPYWISSLQSFKFDQIYHEHISYFTFRSLNYLATIFGLDITHFELVDYHGGSIRVEFSKKEMGLRIFDAQKVIEWEAKSRAFDISFYSTFMNEIKTRRSKFLQHLHELISDNPDIKIVLVGAAAKANTFINFYKLDSTIVSFITDASKLKIGKKTPLSRIPIKDDSALKNIGKVHAIITSWNLAASIKKKIYMINPDIEYMEL